MKLLITGGAGFIGSNFIHYWLKKYPEDQIVNLDLLTYAGNLENLRGAENNPKYKFKKFDICCRKKTNEGFNREIFTKELKPEVEQSDIVVHFAAESHVDRSIKSEYTQDFVLTNTWGTHIMLEAAVQMWGKVNFQGKRFHHISTDEVFGSLGPNDPPFDEHTPYDPRSPYSASKAGADHLVRAYWHTHGLPITISNCSNNYGPRQHTEKLIPLFISNLLQNKPVPLYGTGQNIRDWLYVDDHCSAIDAIIHKGKIGETYLIGGRSNKEKEITNLELAKKLINLLGKDESLIEYVADRKGHDFRYAIDDMKLRSELGWQPQTDFETGLNKTIEWYKNHYA